MSRPGDAGSLSAFVMVITMAVVACAGLVIDGARLVGGRIEVADEAENAARAGAQAIVSLRSGSPSLDRREAARLANAYLAEQGLVGTVVVIDDTVTVTVRATVHMSLLGLVGVGDKVVRATRSARPVTGSAAS